MKRLGIRSVMELLDVSSRETVRKYVRTGMLGEPMRDSAKGTRYWLEEIKPGVHLPKT